MNSAWLVASVAMAGGPASPEPAKGEKPALVTFDAEAVGAAPADFEPVVGDWSVAEREGARGLLVDGSKWRQGTRCGLWSKADSQVLFDDFTVTKGK